MARWLKILLVLVVAIAAVAAVGYRTLTAREAVPETTSFAIDLGELRRVSDSLSGDHPVRIRSALLAETVLPRGAVFAGESLFTPQPFVHQIFELQWKSGMTLVVDTGYTPALR